MHCWACFADAETSTVGRLHSITGTDDAAHANGTLQNVCRAHVMRHMLQRAMQEATTILLAAASAGHRPQDHIHVDATA